MKYAGCGPAPMISLLSEKYPNRHYTGLDLTPAMIEQAKKIKIPNADFVVGDCVINPLCIQVCKPCIS
ncbi:MAG: class I SAM-dependent methyltransferase [Eubacterium ventriosum]